MQILESHHNLSKEYFGRAQLKLAQFLNVVKQFSPSAEVQHKTEVVFRGEGKVQLHNELVGHLCKNVAF